MAETASVANDGMDADVQGSGFIIRRSGCRSYQHVDACVKTKAPIVV
jgi:hypothetical protein